MENNNQSKVWSGQKITPFLWFNDNAEEAMEFYCSIFKNSEMHSLMYYGEAGPGKKGSLMGGSFVLEGQEFKALNGGPMYSFTPAISLFVNCENQEEIDYFWDRLTAGGKEIQCGWLVDKFGLSWQIIPPVLGKMLSDPDREKSKRVMMAMMKMIKIDIKGLEDAYNQE